MKDNKNVNYCWMIQWFVGEDKDFCNTCPYKCVHSKLEEVNGLKRRGSK